MLGREFNHFIHSIAFYVLSFLLPTIQNKVVVSTRPTLKKTWTALIFQHSRVKLHCGNKPFITEINVTFLS